MARPKKEQPNRQDGLYEVKVTVDKTLDGKPIRKSFYSAISKADAKAKAEEYIINMRVSELTGDPIIEKEYSFKTWAQKWLETYKKPNVSENTYKWSYESPVEKFLIPFFGNAKLQKIRPIDIQNFYNKNNSLSESTLNKFRLCLNGIFESAIDNDLCFKNPAKGITPKSTATKHEKKVYTDDEIETVQNFFISEGFLAPAFILETGLRRGEIIGLQWDDVNFDNEVLYVRRSLAVSRGSVKGFTINPPKWGSYRTIPLSVNAIEILKMCDRENKYVFSNYKTDPITPDGFSDRLLLRMEKLHKQYPGIPILSAHELRHTYGTMLRRHGVDIYTIQKILGHKSINVTSEIYVHNEIDTLKKAVFTTTQLRQTRPFISEQKQRCNS